MYTKKEMHSRGRTILIVLTVVYMIVHYSSLFQYFYWITMVPTLIEIFLLVCQLFCK